MLGMPSGRDLLDIVTTLTFSHAMVAAFVAEFGVLIIVSEKPQHGWDSWKSTTWPNTKPKCYVNFS